METKDAPIRAEYGKAGEKLLGLLNLLGEERTDETDRRIRLFFKAIEAVDRCHDALQTSEERKALRRELATFFEGTTANIPAELIEPLHELSTLINSLGKTQEFLRCVELIFLKGELLRVQKDVHDSVTLILEEGACTAELLMMTLGTRDPEFESYMKEIGALGKLCDDIIDLEDDLKTGERVYDKPYSFYGAALSKAVLNALKILWNHPRYARPLFLIQFIPSLLRLIKKKMFTRWGSDIQNLPLYPGGSQP